MSQSVSFRVRKFSSAQKEMRKILPRETVKKSDKLLYLFNLFRFQNLFWLINVVRSDRLCRTRSWGTIINSSITRAKKYIDEYVNAELKMTSFNEWIKYYFHLSYHWRVLRHQKCIHNCSIPKNKRRHNNIRGDKVLEFSEEIGKNFKHCDCVTLQFQSGSNKLNFWS